MLPTRRKQSNLYHRFTKKFVRWFSIDGSDVTENVAVPHMTSMSTSANHRTRDRFRAVSESEDRVLPLLERAPELPSRDHIYNPLSRAPTNGEYASLVGKRDSQPNAPPTDDGKTSQLRGDYAALVAKRDRQSNSSPTDVEQTSQLEGDYFILEKEEDCHTDNQSDAIVLAEDYMLGVNDNTERCSVIRESYLDPTTIDFTRDRKCDELRESTDISTRDSLSNSNYLQLIRASSEIQKTRVDIEQCPIPIDESDTIRGEETERQLEPGEYFILEKEEAVPLDKGGHSLKSSVSQGHAKAQSPENIDRVSDTNDAPSGNDSPNTSCDEGNTSRDYFVLMKPEESHDDS